MSGQFQERSIDPVYRAGYNGTGSTMVKGSIVKLKTSSPAEGEVSLSSAATDKHYGVLANDITTLSFGDVGVRGVVPVLAGGTIAVGDEITSDANGAGVATTTSNDRPIGRALTACSSGQYADVELGVLGETKI